MTLVGILETVMLFCFGFGWPFSIYKSYKARANVGKSLLFLIVIWMGYLLGIIVKALSSEHGFVLWLYVLNVAMVSVDIALYYRNKSLSEQNEKSSSS